MSCTGPRWYQGRYNPLGLLLRGIRWNLIELIAATSIFVMVSYVLGVFLWTDLYRHTDTTQLITIVDSTARYGVPYNSFGGSIVQAARLWGTDAGTVCADPLIPGPGAYPNPPFNHLEYHAYYFVYALAPLSWFFPSDQVVGVSQAVAMALVLLIAYLILRQEGVNGLGAVFFVGLIACYPVWNGPLIQDLYMDRYFPPLALLYLAILYYSLLAPGRPWERHWKWAIPVGVLAASTNDRSIIYVIGINIGVALLMGPKAWLRPTRGLVLLGTATVLLAAALVYYQTRVHTRDLNTIPDAAGRLIGIIDMLRSPALFRFDQTYAELSLKFLVVNAVLFGMWGIFRWKWMLLALASMLPNILTSVGGAEKVSFGLEYHTGYMPVVIFAAALGFAAAWRRLHQFPWRFALSSVTLALGVTLLTLNPFKPGWSFEADFAQQSGVHNVWRFYAYGDQSTVVAHRRLLDQVAAKVPRDATVTVMDNLSPPFYGERGLYFYPVGIDVADYAVLTLEKNAAGGTYFGGAVTYTGEPQQLNECLTRRLLRDGYALDNPQTVGPYAILRRG